MGNLSSLLSEHHVGDQVASGGPGHIWKVYNAKRRENQQPVSLFVFDKSALEKYPTAQRNEVLKMLRHEIRQLTKLRHPHVLAILRPEQETKKAIVVETEPIFACLSNVLRDYDNIQPSHALREFVLEPLEIKIGLMHLTEAVHFLHYHANLIHRNITPSSVFITRKGEWKLGGFNFAAHANYKPGGQQSMPVNEYNSNQKGPRTEPDLDFIAPEYIFTKQYDYVSDMFSLGCLVFQVYAGKKLLTNMNNVLNYKQNVENLQRCISTTRNLPPELHAPLGQLLTINPRNRATSQQFMGSAYFQDVQIQSLVFLSSLLEIDNGKKAAFFKGFLTVLGDFTPRIVEMKVLPPLLEELKNKVQIPFVLPLVMAISEATAPRKFESDIFPHLLPLMMAQPPAPAVSAMMLDHLSLIITKLSAPTVQKKVMPFLYQILDSNSPRMQDLVIRKIPDLTSQIEYSLLVAEFTPRLVQLLSSQPSLRLNVLVCLNKIMPTLDRGHIQEQVLPALESLADVQEPKILTAILHCFATMGPKMGPVIVAQRILPFLAPLTVHQGLEEEHFALLMKTMHSMMDGIRDWRKDEFLARAEVDKHLQPDESGQADFIKHKNFESLVQNKFQETHAKRSTQSASLASAQRQVTSSAPPSSDALSSFEELIRSEERARLQYMQAQSEKEIFHDVGGSATPQNADSQAFRSLSISDTPATPSAVNKAAAFDLSNFDFVEQQDQGGGHASAQDFDFQQPPPARTAPRRTTAAPVESVNASRAPSAVATPSAPSTRSEMNSNPPSRSAGDPYSSFEGMTSSSASSSMAYQPQQRQQPAAPVQQPHRAGPVADDIFAFGTTTNPQASHSDFDFFGSSGTPSLASGAAGGMGSFSTPSAPAPQPQQSSASYSNQTDAMFDFGSFEQQPGSGSGDNQGGWSTSSFSANNFF